MPGKKGHISLTYHLRFDGGSSFTLYNMEPEVDNRAWILSVQLWGWGRTNRELHSDESEVDVDHQDQKCVCVCGGEAGKMWEKSWSNGQSHRDDWISICPHHFGLQTLKQSWNLSVKQAFTQASVAEGDRRKRSRRSPGSPRRMLWYSHEWGTQLHQHKSCYFASTIQIPQRPL